MRSGIIIFFTCLFFPLSSVVFYMFLHFHVYINAINIIIIIVNSIVIIMLS